MKYPRYLPTLLIALAVLALLAVAFWPQARLVDSTRASQGVVRETLEAEGRSRQRYRHVITAPVAAMARRQTLEPGDAVKAGQVVVVLDAVAAPTLDARSRAQALARVAAARALLSAAREETRSAELALAQSRREAERQQALVQRGLVAQETAERIENTRQRAERAAASARFHEATAAYEFQAAEAVLRHGSQERPGQAALELRAPISGDVLRRHHESPRTVQPGEPLIEIGDPTGLEIEVDVLSSDAVRLREGMAVELLRWGEQRPLQGKVRRVEPGGFTKFSALGVEEQRVWVKVDITSPSEEWRRLGDGYRVIARFLLRETGTVRRVPASAVFHDGAQATVFRIDGGRARLTRVTTGLEGEGQVEIREGLAEETPVIVHPERELRDGDRVKTR